MTTDDARLVADEVARCRAVGDVRGLLLGELPVPVAAAFLREGILQSIIMSGHRPDLAELDVMVRFHRLCKIRPSLRRLYPEPKEGNCE